MPRLLILLFYILFSPLQGQTYKEATRGINWPFLGQEKLSVVTFADSHTKLTILDEGEDINKPQFGGPTKAFTSTRSIAGINGGYFTIKNKPIGTVISQGKRIHPLETGSWTVSGIIFDNGEKITLMRSKTYAALSLKERSKTKEAIQGGPFLLEDGKVTAGLNNEKSAYRTFIATDGRGHWCIGISSPLTLRELAAWLVKEKSFGFPLRYALNLDGGSSSLLWTQRRGSILSPSKPVRSYIAISSRQ